jgi:hypothetical protein
MTNTHEARHHGRDYIERTIATVQQFSASRWLRSAKMFAHCGHPEHEGSYSDDRLADIRELLAAAVPDPEGRKESYCANCGKPIHLDRKAWVHAEGNVTCEPSLPMEDTPEWFAKHAAVPDPEEDAT